LRDDGTTTYDESVGPPNPHHGLRRARVQWLVDPEIEAVEIIASCLDNARHVQRHAVNVNARRDGLGWITSRRQRLSK
jgi:hypothetical protein